MEKSSSSEKKKKIYIYIYIQGHRRAKDDVWRRK